MKPKDASKYSHNKIVIKARDSAHALELVTTTRPQYEFRIIGITEIG